MKKNLLMLAVCLMFVSLFTMVTNVYGIQIKEPKEEASLYLFVTKSPETLTNKDVTVTINSFFSGYINGNKTQVSSYELAEINGWTLSDDKQSLTKVFESNTVEDENVKVTVAKVNGNTDFNAQTKEDTAIISVTNIDKVAPVVTQDQKENEDGSIDVLLTVEDEHINKELELKNWTKVETQDKKVLYKRNYTDSANDEVIVTDLADNSTTAEIAVNIDKKTSDKSDIDVPDDTNNNTPKNNENVVDNSGNPETSDIVVYFGIALLLSIGILIATKKYYNSKINNN